MPFNYVFKAGSRSATAEPAAQPAVQLAVPAQASRPASPEQPRRSARMVARAAEAATLRRQIFNARRGAQAAGEARPLLLRRLADEARRLERLLGAILREATLPPVMLYGLNFDAARAEREAAEEAAQEAAREAAEARPPVMIRGLNFERARREREAAEAAAQVAARQAVRQRRARGFEAYVEENINPSPMKKARMAATKARADALERARLRLIWSAERSGAGLDVDGLRASMRQECGTADWRNVSTVDSDDDEETNVFELRRLSADERARLARFHGVPVNTPERELRGLAREETGRRMRG